jgi:hypothetical protein
MRIRILHLVHRRSNILRGQAHVHVHGLLDLMSVHRWGDMRGLIHMRVYVGTGRHVKVWV